MSEGGGEAIRADYEVVAKAEVLTLQRQIRELQRVLGKKTLENEILRKAVKLAHEKKLLISRLPSLPDEICCEPGCPVLGGAALAADPAVEGRGEDPVALRQYRRRRVAGPISWRH